VANAITMIVVLVATMTLFANERGARRLAKVMDPS
jgi:hypothetical protein